MTAIRNGWDPITNYNRTPAQLEEFLLFAILTAGRRNDRAGAALASLLKDAKGAAPFDHIRKLDRKGVLARRLGETGIGFQNQKAIGLASAASAGLNLATASVAELETVKYVAEKTSRFWLMHCRPNQRFAALDVHLLRFMGDYQKAYPASDMPPLPIPQMTPTGKRYAALEQRYLAICDKHRQDPATFDYQIWAAYAVASRGDDKPRQRLLAGLKPKRHLRPAYSPAQHPQKR